MLNSFAEKVVFDDSSTSLSNKHVPSKATSHCHFSRWVFIVLLMCFSCIQSGNAAELTIHGLRLGQDLQTVMDLCKKNKKWTVKKINPVSMINFFPVALSTHMDEKNLYISESDLCYALYSTEEEERAQKMLNEYGLEKNPYSLSLSPDTNSNPIALLGFKKNILIQLKISMDFIDAKEISTESLLQQVSQAVNAKFRQVNLASEKYLGNSFSPAQADSSTAFFSIVENKMLIYVGWTGGFGKSLDLCRLGARDNIKINIGSTSSTPSASSAKPANATQSKSSASSFISSEPALQELPALPSSALRRYPSNSSTAGVTQPQRTRRKCTLCDGKGVRRDSSSIPHFNGYEEDWCETCKGKFQSHIHIPCIGCKGTGYVE